MVRADFGTPGVTPKGVIEGRFRGVLPVGVEVLPSTDAEDPPGSAGDHAPGVAPGPSSESGVGGKFNATANTIVMVRG